MLVEGRGRNGGGGGVLRSEEGATGAGEWGVGSDRGWGVG